MRPRPEFYGNDARPTPAAAPQQLTRLAGLAWINALEPPARAGRAFRVGMPAERCHRARFSSARHSTVAVRCTRYWECALQAALTLATPSSDMEYLFYCRAEYSNQMKEAVSLQMAGRFFDPDTFKVRPESA